MKTTLANLNYALPLAAALPIGAAWWLSSAALPAPVASSAGAEPLAVARIYWEYNDTDDDLGVHVVVDGEDWVRLRIEKPDGHKIFQVRGDGPYRALGMTELFFEGAEPSLDEVPLQELLALFPVGIYGFSGVNAEGGEFENDVPFSHAIPDGPDVSVETGPHNHLRIHWSEVTAPPPGFPNVPIDVVEYQVIVSPSFQLKLPAPMTSVTISPEYVRALGPGEHEFEVLAIDASGNQTLTASTFTL